MACDEIEFIENKPTIKQIIFGLAITILTTIFVMLLLVLSDYLRY